eukprot:3709868-Rhodomonas_salina.2
MQTDRERQRDRDARRCTDAHLFSSLLSLLSPPISPLSSLLLSLLPLPSSLLPVLYHLSSHPRTELNAAPRIHTHSLISHSCFLISASSLFFVGGGVRNRCWRSRNRRRRKLWRHSISRWLSPSPTGAPPTALAYSPVFQPLAAVRSWRMLRWQPFGAGVCCVGSRTEPACTAVFQPLVAVLS